MKPVVLVVDDSEADRYLVGRVARESDGVEDVVELDDGERLVELLDQAATTQAGSGGDPYLVFLDVHMRRMGGLQVLDALTQRGWDRSRTLHVVMMLASGREECIREHAGRSSLVKDFIVKPLDSSEFRRILEELFPDTRRAGRPVSRGATELR